MDSENELKLTLGLCFESNEFQNVCKQLFLSLVICSVRFHIGKSKVERLIRISIQKVEANGKILLVRDTSKLILAMRVSNCMTKLSLLERRIGRVPNVPNTMKLFFFQKVDVSVNETGLNIACSDFRLM